MFNKKISAMKTILMFTVLMAAFSANVYSSSYEEVMTANIQKMNDATSVAEFSGIAGQFERIANAETGKWQPRYYAVYCYLSPVTNIEMSVDDKHKLLDLAQAQMDILLKSFKTESEIYALQSFIYQMRITDMSKGFKYTGLSFEALDQAEKLNPNNPRVYYMRGTNTIHMPKAFGGGKEKAKPLFEKAAALFESQKPANAIEPAWGSEHNKQMLALCDAASE
jgi:hypothetical protein